MTGFARQDSWRQRICPGRRVILILMGLLAVVTLFTVIFGFVGRKYSTGLGSMGENVKSVNRVILAELATLQQKEASNAKGLLKIDQMVKNLSEEAKEVKSQFQDQMAKLQGSLQKLNCDLDNAKHNRTGPQRACCPRGWRLLDQSCYWVSSAQKTWAEAKEDCEAKSAHLAILTSYVEAQFVLQLTKPHMTWIGLKYNGNVWKWVDETTYTMRRIDWKTGEPNMFTHRIMDMAYCVMIYRDGLWCDESCGIRLNWVCEAQAE